MFLTLAIFIATLILVVVRPKPFNEATAAALGALVMLVIGIVSPAQAFDVLKANANVLPKTFTPVSILDIVLETQNEFSKTKPHYTIDLDVKENENQPIESIYCIGDANLLKSVISNIIDKQWN